MSCAEIIAELPRLSPEELPLVQAKLRELITPADELSRITRIYSPRLARAEQAKDFALKLIADEASQT